MLTRVGEKRREERIIRCVPIVISDTFVYGGNSKSPVHEAVTFNVSLSGLSFRTSRPLDHMMALRITSDFLWDGPREGVVRWCSMIYPGIYKVGIALL